MKIMVINANTSESFTNHIREELERVKRPDTELTVLSPESGPETIESAYDEAMAVPGILDLVRKANKEKYDAVVIGCFSDPGLEPAKELSNIPVVGIEESTIHMAAMLGARFSVFTPRKERVASKRAHIHMRGLDNYLASVRGLDLSVAQTDGEPAETKRRVLEAAKKAAEEDGAEVIILGCTGMAGYAPEIEGRLNVKVLDPTAVALKVAEAMVDLGLVHSKRGLFSAPPKKVFK